MTTAGALDPAVTRTIPASVNLIAFADQIGQDLAHPIDVTAYERHLVGQLDVTFRSLAVASGDSASMTDAISGARSTSSGVHDHVARFDARQIEDVVDQVQQRVTVAGDDLQVAPLIGGERTRRRRRAAAATAPARN
jgi:hypothetical protein